MTTNPFRGAIPPDRDEAPPHGIPRPTLAVTIRNADDLDRLRDLLTTLTGVATDDEDTPTADLYRLGVSVLDLSEALLVAISSGDPHGLREVAGTLAPVLGWYECDECAKLLPVDEITVYGVCVGCYEGDGPGHTCQACRESGRLLDSEGLCSDCSDDQDRDAYGAPYGGRDDLPGLLVECDQCGTMTHPDRGEMWRTGDSGGPLFVCWQCSGEPDEDGDEITGNPFGGALDR